MKKRSRNNNDNYYYYINEYIGIVSKEDRGEHSIVGSIIPVERP